MAKRRKAKTAIRARAGRIGKKSDRAPASGMTPTASSPNGSTPWCRGPISEGSPGRAPHLGVRDQSAGREDAGAAGGGDRRSATLRDGRQPRAVVRCGVEAEIIFC
jgi:hypothetical protein